MASDAKRRTEFRRTESDRDGTPTTLKVATFNVNGINGRLPLLLRWSEEAEPDIVCLQELKAPQAKLPQAA